MSSHVKKRHVKKTLESHSETHMNLHLDRSMGRRASNLLRDMHEQGTQEPDQSLRNEPGVLIFSLKCILPPAFWLRWEEPSMDQYQCRGETLEELSRPLVHTNFPRKRDGPMALKVL